MLFQPPLRVVASGPEPGRYADASGLTVWIEFSTSVPHGQAENGAFLKENGTTMEVRYRWSGRRVVLAPVQGLALGNRYDLIVSSSVEDGTGHDLGTEFLRTFYTRPDDLRPTAAVTAPGYGTTSGDRYQPVTVRFSRAPDRASFYSAFSSTPSFKAAYDWENDDTVCVVTPLEELKSPQVYTLKVGSGLTDVYGNTSGEDVVSWFSEGTADQGPSVASVVRTVSGTADESYVLEPVSGNRAASRGFERTWGLELRFDRPVQRSGLESFITVDPGWDYSIPYSQALVQKVDLVPSGPLVYGKTYTLTVHEGVADSAGNLLKGNRVYRFTVDGPASAPPRLRTIEFNTNLPDPVTNVIQGNHGTDFTTLNAEGFGNVAAPTFLVLTFDVAQGASMNVASFMSHFSISATDVGTSMPVTAVGLPVTLDAAQTVRVDVLFTRAGSGLLVFKLSAGLSDSLGNSTPEDEVWPVME
jgi:hypothetical protein